MNSSFYWQLATHLLVELAAALAVVVGVARGWQSTPAPFGVRLVRQTGRLWLAIIYAVLPGFFGLLTQRPMLQLYQHEAWSFARLPVTFSLSVFYGILLGLAASCCASPVGANEKFPWRPALAIGLLLVVLPNLFWVGTMPYRVAMRFVLVVSIVTVARLCREGRPAPVADGATPADPATPAPPRRSPTMALLIGFAPSVILLAGITIATTAPLSNDASAVLLWLGSGVSVLCCFTASILIFSRKTGAAIFWGLVLLLLNGFIAFFLGCCASLSNTKF